MKTLFIGICLTVLAAMALSCEEDGADPARVWGKMYCSNCASDYKVSGGTLAKGGENYYGWCKRIGNEFEFAVGDGRPGTDDLSSYGHYFEFRGIKGPPVSGVYESGTTWKNDPIFTRNFKSARVVNVNDWKIYNIPNETCHASLYAEAAEGELTPKAYESAEFDYFVEIRCSGLSVESTTGSVLEGMGAQVWFRNCDEED